MAAAAVIGSIVAGVLPGILQATKKPVVMDTTPQAPGYSGPDSFADALNEKEKPNYTRWIIGGSVSIFLLLIFLIMRKR